MTRDRMKLSDVEAQKKYVFRGPPTTFEKAFPTIEDIKVEIRPVGEGFRPMFGETESLYVYTKDDVPAHFDCRNPLCYGGGVDLDRLIRWTMVSTSRTEFEETISCRGYEGSPKGKKKYDDCDTYFKVKITVKYKE